MVLQRPLAHIAREPCRSPTVAPFFTCCSALAELSKTTNYSVTYNTLILPPSRNPRDFVSIGPYMWPCNNIPVGCLPGTLPEDMTCNTATGLPWVCRRQDTSA